jgi:outer membrane protein assembly factor BamB
LEGENNLLIAANKLMMVSKADGKKIWSTDDLGFLECPIVIGDEIYIRNTDTTLYLIDKRTGLEMGSLLIQMNTLNKRDFFRGPVAVNGLLAVPFGDERLLFYEP